MQVPTEKADRGLEAAFKRLRSRLSLESAAFLVNLPHQQGVSSLENTDLQHMPVSMPMHLPHMLCLTGYQCKTLRASLQRV